MRLGTRYVVGVRGEGDEWNEYTFNRRKEAYEFAKNASRIWGTAGIIHEVRGKPSGPVIKFVQGHGGKMAPK
jgi:hypothetical protein